MASIGQVYIIQLLWELHLGPGILESDPAKLGHNESMYTLNVWK